MGILPALAVILGCYLGMLRQDDDTCRMKLENRIDRLEHRIEAVEKKLDMLLAKKEETNG